VVHDQLVCVPLEPVSNASWNPVLEGFGPGRYGASTSVKMRTISLLSNVMTFLGEFASWIEQ
jgi:hypothetical protein